MGRCLVIAMTFGLCMSGFSFAPTSENPGVVSPLPAAQPEQRSIFANGVVEGRGREALLRFEIAGRITAVAAVDGMTVHKGDVLAQLDRTALECDLAKAEASLALEQAERDRLVNGARRETRDHAWAQH